jgi:putative ABC transport system ATP-binding protein
VGPPLRLLYNEREPFETPLFQPALKLERTMPAAVVVQAQDLTRLHGSGDTAITALDGVNLSVARGEFLAVMGPSGCGKSTLLHLLGGLDAPSRGSVLFEGQPVHKLSDDAITQLRRRKIGYIFQFFNLIPVLTAIENAALPLVLDGIAPAVARAKAGTLLEQVGLGNRLKSRPDQLSAGQQQRVAIARALVAEPALVLADEPTGNLDTVASQEIAALLQQVAREWGRSVLMVTHDARVAAHADRVVFLRDGRIAQETVLERNAADNQALLAGLITAAA